MTVLVAVYGEACMLCDMGPKRWLHADVCKRETSMMPNVITSSVSKRAARDPKNYASAFVVTNSGFFQAMVNILNHIGGAKGKFQLASSVEAAQAAIAERRKMMPPLSEVVE